MLRNVLILVLYHDYTANTKPPQGEIQQALVTQYSFTH